jgi:DNA-binding protein H-NS
MIDLIVKLIEKCIQLVQQRQEANRKLYTDFVEPAISDFEKVHQNYLETFKQYREMLTSDSTPINSKHPVLQKLEQDINFSAHLRTKLTALHQFKDDPVFGTFIMRIVQYTEGGEMSKIITLKGRRLFNTPRSATIVGLSQLFNSEQSEDEKRAQALALMDKVIEELQWAYGQVIEEQLKLKRQTLDKRL